MDRKFRNTTLCYIEKDKVTYLERRLKSVISEERYEEAAAIRKEINRLKEKANKS